MSVKDTGLSSKRGYDLFLWGGISTACGEIATIPIDVVKVRMQVGALMGGKRQSMVNTFVNIVKNEGVLALYLGTSPAVWRQLLYGGLRIGLYEPIKKLISGKKKEMMRRYLLLLNYAQAFFLGLLVLVYVLRLMS